MDYAEMKVAAKKLGIKSVGVKKEKMLDSILDKIEEMMDVEGWVEAHQDLMTIYNAETETEAGEEEEEGIETSEGIEVNEDELAEAEEKAKVAKEKADKKKAEKKEKKTKEEEPITLSSDEQPIFVQCKFAATSEVLEKINETIANNQKPNKTQICKQIAEKWGYAPSTLAKELWPDKEKPEKKLVKKEADEVAKNDSVEKSGQKEPVNVNLTLNEKPEKQSKKEKEKNTKIESVPSYVSEIGNAIDALSSGIMKAKEDSWKHYSKKDIKDAIENLHTYI